MKLFIISNNPNRPSFRQRIEIFLPMMRNSGIEPDVQQLPDNCSSRKKLFKISDDYDAVLLHKKCLNIIDSNILRKHAKKIIYDFDDAIMYKAAKPDAKYSSHMRLFKRAVKMADKVIAGNNYLAEHAIKFNSNVEIIPTGLVVDDYRVEAEKPDDGKIRLVWIGSRATLRYLKQIKSALEEIGSRFDNVILRIICNDFIELDNMQVEPIQWSLSRQAHDLRECDIGLAPLDDNRFTRGKCGYKILQYYAAGLSVVASPVGVNSDYILEPDAGLLAKDTNQWIENIGQLISDTKMRKTKTQNSLSFIKQFDVDVLGRKLIDCIATARD